MQKQIFTYLLSISLFLAVLPSSRADVTQKFEVPQELVKKDLSISEAWLYQQGLHPLQSTSTLQQKLDFSDFAQSSSGSGINYSKMKVMTPPSLGYIASQYIFIVGQVCDEFGECKMKVVGNKCHYDIFVKQTSALIYPWLQVEHPQVQPSLFKLAKANLGNGEFGWWFQFRSEEFRWIKDGEGGHPEFGCHTARITLSVSETDPILNPPISSTPVKEASLASFLLNAEDQNMFFPYVEPFSSSAFPGLQDSPQILNVVQRVLDKDGNTSTSGSVVHQRIRCQVEVHLQDVSIDSLNNGHLELKYKALALNTPLNISVDPAFTKYETIASKGVNGSAHDVTKVTYVTEDYISETSKFCLGADLSLSDRYQNLLDRSQFKMTGTYGDSF